MNYRAFFDCLDRSGRFPVAVIPVVSGNSVDYAYCLENGGGAMLCEGGVAYRVKQPIVTIPEESTRIPVVHVLKRFDYRKHSIIVEKYLSVMPRCYKFLF